MNEQNCKILADHLRCVIANTQANQITGMSIANLQQITPTLGLDCRVSAYTHSFPIVAREVAAELNFQIID